MGQHAGNRRLGVRLDQQSDSTNTGGYDIRRTTLSCLILALLAVGCSGGKPRHPSSQEPLAANAWSARFTAGSAAVTDSSGSSWRPADAIQGGAITRRARSIGGTASPQLYQSERVGLASWSIPVPRPGRYAVDLLFADLLGTHPGEDVFRVSAGDRSSSRTLAENLDLASVAGFARSHHVIGLVDVHTADLVLTFAARSGRASVNGVRITSDGATQPARTTLTQNFAGAAGERPDSAIWSSQAGTGFGGSQALQAFSASRQYVSLDGEGNLVITATRTPYRGANGMTADWTSGRLATKGKFSFSYGHVEASLKAPSGSGMWPAFWAMGTDEDKVGWPACGEIDVFEGLGRDPQAVAGFAHALGRPGDARIAGKTITNAAFGTTWHSPINTTTGFHTYAIDYQPSAISYSVDGHSYYVVTAEDRAAGQAWPFDGRRFYLILNLAIGNLDWTGRPNSQTPTSAALLINRVTVTQ